jgi:hypothetical protein
VLREKTVDLTTHRSRKHEKRQRVRVREQAHTAGSQEGRTQRSFPPSASMMSRWCSSFQLSAKCTCAEERQKREERMKKEAV